MNKACQKITALYIVNQLLKYVTEKQYSLASFIYFKTKY